MRIIGAAIFLIFSSLAQAFDLTGTHSIVLSNAQGERIPIGTVSFTAIADDRAGFTITLDDKLEEYFLAMRPFRCLTGSQQRLCHFPVEHEPPVISRDDLVTLEYALMFMRTAPKSLHVNPFNGVFYKLRMSSRGIEGRVNDVDMDPFITPDSVPIERRKRPIRPQDLSPGDESSHWLPFLTIE